MDREQVLNEVLESKDLSNGAKIYIIQNLACASSKDNKDVHENPVLSSYQDIMNIRWDNPVGGLADAPKTLGQILDYHNRPTLGDTDKLPEGMTIQDE